MKDSVHLFGDGHFHPARMGEPDGGGRGEDSFGNHAVHAGNDVGELALVVVSEDFDAVDVDLFGNAVRLRTDGTSNVGAMAVFVGTLTRDKSGELGGTALEFLWQV